MRVDRRKGITPSALRAGRFSVVGHSVDEGHCCFSAADGITGNTWVSFEIVGSTGISESDI